MEKMDGPGLIDNRYLVDDTLKPQPMFTHPDRVDADIALFMLCFDRHDVYPVFTNPWFNDTLVPAVKSYEAYRSKAFGLMIEYTKQIKAPDWRLAFTEWYTRRTRSKVTS